jgi:hypothetical protein
MPDDRGVHQSRTVSEVISSYVTMTSGQRQRPQQLRVEEPQKPSRQRTLIDNEGLALHEGNDFV